MSTPPVTGLLSSALAAMDAEQLTALLQARPDLATPPPLDLGELATRAATESSTARALDGLNRWQLTVAEALAALPDAASTKDVAILLDASPLEVAPALTRLQELALVWGGPDAWHVLRAVRTAFGPWPGGLAHPSAMPLTEAEIVGRLADLPATSRTVVDRLQWGPPTGTVAKANRPLTVDQASTPVEHLLARGLLRPTGPDAVILPREVALLARGGFTRYPVPVTVPGLPAGRTGKLVDLSGVGAAIEFVQDIEAVVDGLAEAQATLLRTGGLSVRDVTAQARNLGIAPDRYSFLVEVAAAAQLLAPTPPAVRATTQYDKWLGLGLLDRYRHVLDAWLGVSRWTATSRATGGHTLGVEADAGWAPGLRRTICDFWDAGLAADAEVTAAAVDWLRPSAERHLPVADLVAEVTREARWLGLIALDSVTALVVLAHDADTALPAAVRQAFPEPVTEVIIQADLTAVAPGPLAHDTASVLRLLADRESRGGGGVWRFARDTVRRGFDAGWTGQSILQWLAAHSATGVPQPLKFLVDDVARTHGAIRVGQAASYVRVDDPARLSAIVNHPLAGELGLRQVGPATLVAEADADEVVELLRTMGLSPAAENALGEMVQAPGPARTHPAKRTSRAAPSDPASVAQQLLTQLELSTRATANTSETLSLLRRAYREQRRLRVDYVGSDGTKVSRDAVPTDLGAGMVRLRTSGQRSIAVPLARVIQVVETDA